ncbi:MAG: hypothetical protein M0Z58_08940 [Nitrospiraceae bacterium]|nr:hypothetical protein [Nitrospiraceae bacterium]
MITEQVTLAIAEGGKEKKKGESMKCVTFNISDSGVGVYTEKSLDRGAAFMIYSGKLWALPRRGIVKWCRKLAPGLYRAGIEMAAKGQDTSFSCAEEHEDFKAGE